MAAPGLVRRDHGADLGEIVWADATSTAMDAAFVIAEEPEAEAKQFTPPPRPQYKHSPVKRARKGPPAIDLLALALVIGSHLLGAWLTLPEVWDNAAVVVLVYSSAVAAIVSGRCVARMDHFCVWLGCPVGAGNHRLFVAFVHVAALHLGVCTVAAWYALSKHLHQGGGWPLLLADALLVAIGGGFTLFVVLLAGTQTVNAAIDVTGRERIRGLSGGGRGADERSSKWAAHWSKTSSRLLDNTTRFWVGGM